MDRRGTGAEEILDDSNRSQSKLSEADIEQGSAPGQKPEGKITTTGTSEAPISLPKEDTSVPRQVDTEAMDYEEAASRYDLLFGEAGFEVLRQLEGEEPQYDPSEQGALGYMATVAGLESKGMIQAEGTTAAGSPEISTTEYGGVVLHNWRGMRNFLGSPERVEMIQEEEGDRAAVSFLNDAGIDVSLHEFLEAPGRRAEEFGRSYDAGEELYEIAELLQDPGEVEQLFEAAQGDSAYDSGRGLRGIADNGVLTESGERLYRKAKCDQLFDY